MCTDTHPNTKLFKEINLITMKLKDENRMSTYVPYTRGSYKDIKNLIKSIKKKKISK